jgi:hypothetical protein
MTTRFAYSAFGLGIHSDLALPGLTVHPHAADDVVIRFGEVRYVPGDLTPGGELPSRSHLFGIVWEGIGKSIVRRGQEIVLESDAGVDDSTLRRYVMGALLPVVLYQRGFLVLHASAVEIGNRTVAFLGASGWGKSTLAAALQARGHRVISDDLVPVLTDFRSPRICPGPPSLKLWRDAARTLEIAFDHLPLVHPDEDKRSYPTHERPGTQTLSLAAMYVLEYGSPSTIEALAPAQILMEVVRHTFVRFQDNTDEGGAYLQQCADLVAHVPTFRLRRERDLDRLPQVVNAVEEHCCRERDPRTSEEVG